MSETPDTIEEDDDFGDDLIEGEDDGDEESDD